MNAKDAIDLLDQCGSCDILHGNEELVLRALRLLAAAEANDGKHCQLIEDLRTEADLCRNETAEDIAELLDDAASSLIAAGALFNAVKDERNGLAARVAELERAVDLAARAMAGEGVEDQGQAWDRCLRILDAARSQP